MIQGLDIACSQAASKQPRWNAGSAPSRLLTLHLGGGRDIAAARLPNAAGVRNKRQATNQEFPNWARCMYHIESCRSRNAPHPGWGAQGFPPFARSPHGRRPPWDMYAPFPNASWLSGPTLPPPADMHLPRIFSYFDPVDSVGDMVRLSIGRSASGSPAPAVG